MEEWSKTPDVERHNFTHFMKHCSNPTPYSVPPTKVPILECFAKLRKAIFSFDMSVRPSALNNLAPIKWICIKCEI
jgi:hypothetical protein